MRLARPVYESLPYTYMAIGGVAIIVFYIDIVEVRAMAAFCIGLFAETAALTLILRRLGCRALSREYSGGSLEPPTTLQN